MSKMSELDADVAVAKSLEQREPLPPIEKILDRLEVLWGKLEAEGQYVRANTVALAIEAIRRSEAKP